MSEKCDSCGATLILRELLADSGASIEDLLETYNEWKEEFHE